ncbi:hypothetical protein, partial [Mesorhizobium sp. M0800]|uniref:hypothetical protein n=1 Tax=Mesorhizobium sp. M0800 TaxID=2957000 RepID=UPI0033390C58
SFWGAPLTAPRALLPAKTTIKNFLKNPRALPKPYSYLGTPRCGEAADNNKRRPDWMHRLCVSVSTIF